MAAIDLDRDGNRDLAVVNRQSADLSGVARLSCQAGYGGVDHLYLVDGNVVGLAVQDFNHDGRDDVIQLHRSSGDFSVRLPIRMETLQAPVFLHGGNTPASQIFVDVNGDRVLTRLARTLERLELSKDLFRFDWAERMGRSGASNVTSFRPESKGGCFALVRGDFDSDGNIDLAAGFS